MVTNKEIAVVLESVADLLEIDEASPFRIRAYRNGADSIRYHGTALQEMVADGADLTQLQDVGKGLAKAIEDIVTLGIPAFRAQLSQTYTPGLLDLLSISGLGPKRVRMLRDELGVRGPADLRQAVLDGRLRELRGFGPKTEKDLLRRLDRLEADAPGDAKEPG